MSIKIPSYKKKLWYSIISIFLSLIFNARETFGLTFPNSIPITCNKITQSNSNFNDNFVEFLKKWHIPGASISVMQNNKMILSCGYGWADLEKRQTMQPDSCFRLASVSKTITAIAILNLIQQKKLQLNDKVFKILSGLKPLNELKLNPQIYQITLRNLLQMSSGWYTDRPKDDDPMFGPWSSEMLAQLNGQIPPDCETAARMMMSMPLQFTPGTKFSYSNLNYCLLGLVINKIEKQNSAAGYEGYIKQNLLSPLNINDMQIGSTQIENKLPHEVKYYVYDTKSDEGKLDGLPYGSTDLLKKNYADGGWIASSSDLVKLLQAFYDDKIVRSNMKKMMLQRPKYFHKKSGYPAMGWDEVTFENGKYSMSKQGFFTGTKTFILQISDGVSYAVLFNTNPPHRDEFIKQLKEKLALLKLKGQE